MNQDSAGTQHEDVQYHTLIAEYKLFETPTHLTAYLRRFNQNGERQFLSGRFNEPSGLYNETSHTS